MLLNGAFWAKTILGFGAALIASVLSCPAFASISALPTNLTYPHSEFPNPSVPIATLGQFSRIFVNEGFSVLDATNTGNIPIFGVDQVYFDSLSREAVFVKFDLEPSDPLLRGALRSGPGGVSVFHSERRKGVQFTAVFYRVSSDRANRIISALHQVQTASSGFSLISPAEASGPGCLACGASPEVQEVGQLSGLHNKLNENQLAGVLAACAGGVLKGAWASTGGALGAIANATIRFTKDPLGSLQKLGPMAEQLLNFLGRFPGEVSRIWNNFSDLDPRTQTELGCEFLGSLGADVLLAVITGGIASVKWPLVVAKIEQYASRLQKLEKLTNYLAQSRDFAVQGLRRGIFRRLAGTMDETHISAIQKFSDRDLMDLAVGAAACGI